MSELYPQPPHLSVAVYSDRPEAETFARMCDAARDLGCVSLNLVEVAPADLDFELVSDLGAAKEIRPVSPAEFTELVADPASATRLLRAGFSHRKYGKVVVEYVQRVGLGRHPIALTVASDSLGIPDSIWSGRQRKSAYALAAWSTSALRTASSLSDPLYGAIGIEFSLPAAPKLAAGQGRVPSEVFVSRRLIEADQSLEERLRQAFAGGDVAAWEHGRFYSGWAPFTSRRVSVEDPKAAADNAARALRSALLAWTAH
jgi:hypothetical protein